MPRGERSPDQTQITISLSKMLLQQINEEAKLDNRSRSNWIVQELAEAVKAKRQMRGASGEQKLLMPERVGETLTKIHAPDVPIVNPSRSSARPVLNEDAADEGAKPRGDQTPQPAPRMTRTRAALRSMAKKKTEK